MSETPDPVEHVLGALQDAARNEASPWRWPVLASRDETGRPRTRIMIVRHFDAEACEIELHTDARSAKRAELVHDPACALLFFDKKEMIQIRIAGTARLHREDEIAEAAWTRAPASSWSDYAGQPGPGAVIPAPARLERDPGPDGERARENFAAIRIALREGDWLHITEPEHRRARIDFTAEPAEWVWTAP